MSQENVVPFEASRRRAMARRGAADKTFVSETVTVDCPFCAASLCLDAGAVSANSEVLCSACRRVIDLGGPETADSRS